LSRVCNGHVIFFLQAWRFRVCGATVENGWNVFWMSNLA